MTRGPDAEDPAEETLGAVLEGLRALIPRSLLDGPGWERLLDRIGGLPAPAAALCGFEYRLGDPAPAADFCVPVVPGRPVARHHIRLGEAAEPDSAQAALARALAEIDRPESSLSRWINGMLLEYDIAEVPPDQCPAPGVFLLLRDPSPGPDRDDPHSCPPSLLAATLAGVAGWSADDGERRAVEQAFDALPPGGEIVHAGALPGREPRAIRLVAQRIEEPELPGFLARLGWPGPVRTASALLSDLRGLFARFRISFDTSVQGPLPRLGLELDHAGYGRPGVPDDWMTLGRSTWRPLVTRLEEAGWCLPEKAHGLLAWPGMEKLYAREGIFLAFKGISHVKITMEEDAMHAKAYTGIRFLPFKP